MGSTQSSASSSDTDTNDEIGAPKSNRKLFQSDSKKDKKDKKDKKNKKSKDKTPTLHPNAQRVVRPFDSQIIYNHGRVGIHGLGPESQKFPCVCQELEQARVADSNANSNTSQQPSSSLSDNEKASNSNNINPDGTAVPVYTAANTSSQPLSNAQAIQPKVDLGTGRCGMCGGVVLPTNVQSDPSLQALPSCSWHDGATIGSLLNSMLLAQRDFSESLRKVQTEEQPLVTLSRMTNFDMPTLRALQSVFDAISAVDGSDNLISARELCIATGTPPDSLLGKALFRLMDITRSNQINFRTWVLMLSKLSPTASLEDKISFAFNLYDDNGDGFIERAELIHMLRSAIPELSEADAMSIIESIFDKTDQDRDNKITIEDYRSIASSSADFYEAFTIDVPSVLRHYNVISQEEIDHRVVKLRERDARQDEKILEGQAKEQAFMERDEDDLHVVDDVDLLDLE